jgi:hypothetical protein
MAIARPMPLPPPVTMAVLLSSRFISLLSFHINKQTTGSPIHQAAYGIAKSG